jgi:pre-mRNA-splicing factor CWC22
MQNTESPSALLPTSFLSQSYITVKSLKPLFACSRTPQVNASNVKAVLPELFHENLLRGQGVLCQSLLRAQAASPTFTPVFAALVAVVNTKFPEIGRLLCERVLSQFKRAFRRNDKPVATAALRFIAHLTNQHVLNELLALEILMLLLESPTGDSVELAIVFVKEVGAALEDAARAAMHEVFARFRAILQEGTVAKKTQYQVEGLMALRKAGFEKQGLVAVKPELDLVEEEDQIEHEVHRCLSGLCDLDCTISMLFPVAVCLGWRLVN